MYQIKNRLRQQIPVDIIRNGESQRILLSSRQRIETEDLTSTIKTLKNRRMLNVTKIEKEEEVVENQETETVVDLEELDAPELAEIAETLEIPTNNATRKDTLIKKLLEHEDRVQEYLSK